MKIRRLLILAMVIFSAAAMVAVANNPSFRMRAAFWDDAQIAGDLTVGSIQVEVNGALCNFPGNILGPGDSVNLECYVANTGTLPQVQYLYVEGTDTQPTCSQFGYTLRDQDVNQNLTSGQLTSLENPASMVSINYQNQAVDPAGIATVQITFTLDKNVSQADHQGKTCAVLLQFYVSS